MPPKRAKTTAIFWPNVMQPRQDSNLDQALRKRLFYPLNYGAVLHALRVIVAGAKMRPFVVW